jgi:polyisoprenoid-binding protein YceI
VDQSTGVRKWGLRIGVPLAVILLLVVVGPFVYINFIADDAPEELTLPSVSPDTTGAASRAAGSSASSLDGKWSVTGGSQAGYRVKEIIFGQDNDAVGRTEKVTGEFTLTGTTVQNATITVDMASITSDEERRDRQFHGRIMSTGTFPTSTFTLSQPISVPSVPAENAETTVSANGQLTLRGVTKPVTAQLTARRSGATISVAGSIPIIFSEWNIPNPSTPGVTTQDNGVVEFLLNFAKA